MESVPMNSAEIITANQLAQRVQKKVSWVYEKSRTRGKYSGTPIPRLHGMGRSLRFYWPDVCAWLRGEEKLAA
jgi:predicted DNA-binding transcriptional regulator AlpA